LQSMSGKEATGKKISILTARWPPGWREAARRQRGRLQLEQVQKSRLNLALHEEGEGHFRGNGLVVERGGEEAKAADRFGDGRVQLRAG
jgi:hypothetical protein